MSWNHLTLLLYISFVYAQDDTRPSITNVVSDNNVQKREASDNANVAPSYRKTPEGTERDGVAVLSVYDEQNGVGTSVNALIPLRSSPSTYNFNSPNLIRSEELNRFKDLRSMGGFQNLRNINENVAPRGWNNQNGWPNPTRRSNPYMGQFGPQLEIRDMDSLIRANELPSEYGRLEPPNPPLQYGFPSDRRHYPPINDFFKTKNPNKESTDTIPWSPMFDTNDFSGRRSIGRPPPIPNLKPAQAVYRQADYSPERFTDYEVFDRQASAPGVRDIVKFEPHNAFTGYQGFDRYVQPVKGSAETNPDDRRGSAIINQPNYEIPPGSLRSGLNRITASYKNQLDEATNNMVALNAINPGRLNGYMFDKAANELNARSTTFNGNFGVNPDVRNYVSSNDRELEASFLIERANEFLRSGASNDGSGLRKVDHDEVTAIKNFYSQNGANTNTLPKNLSGR